MTGDGAGRRPWLERLLPVAIVAAATVLFASELMITFEFTPPGGEALAEQSAGDRHSYAQMVLAAFAVIALFVAVAAGSKPAATAVAACGVIALLIFLLLDLPDANNIGTLDDPRQSFFEAEAVPQAGFWLGLLGSLGLALTGAALATLTSEQISALGPGGGRRPKLRREPARRRRADAPTDVPAKGAEAATAAKSPRTGAQP
ncbi:MAG: hypothetical protein ACR2G3_00725 [Solirubrobacterales bacterium]